MPAPPPAGRRLRLGPAALFLDRGGVVVLRWPNEAALFAEAAALGALASPVVRLAGGALVGDLTLQDNLMLEPALHDGVLPRHLLPEIDTLFEQAGAPIAWRGWAATLPRDATPLALLQLRAGRALVADPDLLLLDADTWDDGLLAPAAFSRAFARQYPWRPLVWATCDPGRQARLQRGLQDFLEPAA